MGHMWNDKWPAQCTRCGVGKVMERAIYEEWVTQPKEEEGGPDVWKSSGHRELVLLCDDHCYADMGHDAVKNHMQDILDLCDKIGWKPNAQQGTMRQVS